jgi:hypothetical protein
MDRSVVFRVVPRLKKTCGLPCCSAAEEDPWPSVWFRGLNAECHVRGDSPLSAADARPPSMLRRLRLPRFRRGSRHHDTRGLRHQVNLRPTPKWQ